MAVTLNALTTGVGGLQTTGDTSGAIQLQSNGTATLTVDASGNVGIGTSSPTTILNIQSSAPILRCDTSGVATLSVGFNNSGGSVANIATGTSAVWMQQAYPLTFGTNGSERMRIGTSGEIGLGGANYGTSGQFLKSNGPGAAATWGTAGGGFSNMQVFTSPGTFTTPSTTTQIKVTVVGGGGNGGTGIPSTNAGSGGGGGGAAIYVGPVTASTGYAVTVGGAGGTSSFGVLASATGGATGGSAPLGAGGAGGAGSAGTLQIGGGGGSVGQSNQVGSVGGSSFLGGGAQASVGAAGKNYGGGGSGGSGSAPTAGGAGAPGVVVVEY